MKCFIKIKLIQFECGPANIDSRVFFRDYYFFLKKKNFLIYRLTPSKIFPITEYDFSLDNDLSRLDYSKANAEISINNISSSYRFVKFRKFNKKVFFVKFF